MRENAAAATFKLFGQTIHHRHHQRQSASATPSEEARPRLTIPTPDPATAAAAFQKEATSEREDHTESDEEAEPSSPSPTSTRGERKKPASGAEEGDADGKRVTPKDKSGVDRTAKCPRCDSSDTKFCYFNNYNASQPRHFCRRCQRFWTNGGNQRNLPIGSGRRKRKPKAAEFIKDQGTQILDGFLCGQSLPSCSSSVPSGSWRHGVEELNLGEVNQEAFTGLLVWPHGGHPPSYYCFDSESCNTSVSSGSKPGSSSNVR